MRILITGASSGLGRALAEQAAAPGTTLFLGGRNPAALSAVAEAVRARGGVAETAMVDVRDRAGLAGYGSAVVGGWTWRSPTPAFPAAPAARPSRKRRREKSSRWNVTGVMNTLFPAIALMRAQPAVEGWRGRLCIVASVASGIPPACARLSRQQGGGQGVGRGDAPGLRADGVLLTVACPGYIRTPMTDANRFPMPGLMDADLAARKILAACRAGRVRTSFPWWLALAARTASLLPPRVLGAIMARGPAKERLP